MKINYNNTDLKIIDCARTTCTLCAFKSHHSLHYCQLFCRLGKLWIKDIFNSDIFRL